MKKLFLTLAMALVAVASFAQDVEVDGIYYNLNNETKTAEVTNDHSWSVVYSGDVVIPEYISVDGSTFSVTSIGDNAFSESSGLISVEIPNSVTSIGDWAFYQCFGLISVEIPNSVTSIGDWAFDGCNNVEELIYAEGCTTALRTGLTSIKKVTIPNSVTSIGDYAFYDCSGLTSVVIPNSVTSIGDYAFLSCTGLTSVTIGNSVTGIGDGAFDSCSGLISVEIPNSVTSCNKQI